MYEHVAMVRAYKQLLHRKRHAWKAKTQQELCEMASRNPCSFWCQYSKRQNHRCRITREQWKSEWQSAFKALYSAQTTKAPADDLVNPPHSSIPPPIPDNPHAAQALAFDFLTADIRQDKIEAALKRLVSVLKRNEDSSVDGIRAEHILDASELLLNYFVQSFNQLLKKGVPPAWCTGLIYPIFNNGYPEDAATGASH